MPPTGAAVCRAEAVERLLSDANHSEALRAALLETTQDENAALTRVLMATPEGKIDASIESLSLTEERDVLMKYLFKLLGDKSAAGSSRLLAWHGKLVASAGQGPIVRALVDRKTV